MAQSVQRTSPDAAGKPAAGSWSAAHAGRPAIPATRPLGLSILALADAALGVALLLWAGAWFGATDIVAGTRLAALAQVAGTGLVVAAGLELVLACGVWAIRPWARPLGITVGIIAIVLTVMGAGRGPEDAHLLTLLLEVGTVWYLLTPEVHDLFDPPRDGPAD